MANIHLRPRRILPTTYVRAVFNRNDADTPKLYDFQYRIRYTIIKLLIFLIYKYCVILKIQNILLSTQWIYINLLYYYYYSKKRTTKYFYNSYQRFITETVFIKQPRHYYEETFDGSEASNRAARNRYGNGRNIAIPFNKKRLNNRINWVNSNTNSGLVLPLPIIKKQRKIKKKQRLSARRVFKYKITVARRNRQKFLKLLIKQRNIFVGAYRYYANPKKFNRKLFFNVYLKLFDNKGKTKQRFKLFKKMILVLHNRKKIKSNASKPRVKQTVKQIISHEEPELATTVNKFKSKIHRRYKPQHITNIVMYIFYYILKIYNKKTILLNKPLLSNIFSGRAIKREFKYYLKKFY